VNIPNDAVPGAGPEVREAGIVSVNDRGSSGGNPLGKVFFVVGLCGLLLVAGTFGYNRYRAAQNAKTAAAKQTNKNESKPAQAGILRDFEKEAAAAAAASPPAVPGTSTAASGNGGCSDGSSGIEALGPDSKPLLTAQGVAMRVCADGHVFVPKIDGAAPIGVVANQQSGTPKPSRYGGEAIIASAVSALSSVVPNSNLASIATDPAAQAAYINSLVQQSRNGIANGGGATPGAAAAGMAQQAPPAPSTGSIGSQLTPSSTPLVVASMLGDRNMILPKGRSIDCGLSMRLISDLPGLASCILTQNVYSDNGKILLLERGSEAVGEYSAGMAQGQERVFVLWTRIKTPTGVVINLNSPGADDLGTSGLPGVVNNHWWKRLGAAALLTIVQDAIAYKTAQASNAGTGTLAVYQNTGQTTNNMAETILASTINIKPTLYKNQGDRSTIYVARDLDFGSVYALRPR
jgi:type IV secretion system protein VirB10